jgi:GTP pyrophosphokinase
MKDLTPEEKNKIIQSRFRDLIESSPRLQKPESAEKVQKAFEFAEQAHKGQLRKTGLKLPYISHPIAVAKIVACEMGFGSTTVAAALLHDVVEDTSFTVENIRSVFGDDIALIVDGMTKITNVYNPDRTEQAATFQKLILKMSEDKRVAFVKIADRLHNLRTMDKMRINSKVIKTAEALSVYAPLAFQLGLFNIRNEIENISFRLREPEEYTAIENVVNRNSKQLDKVSSEISQKLQGLMSDANIDFEVVPVRKSLYRLRSDMKKKKMSFDQMKNFQSERIVFKADPDKDIKEQCFSVYCKVSSVYRVRPDSLRDWVSNPRLNGFQTLVFDIVYDGSWKEIQIMTHAMHEIAQRGYAKNHDNLHVKNIENWVNATEKMMQDNDLTNREILDLAQAQDTEIHVLTPKGDVVTLAKGSTVLDFAFKIHSELGLHFLSAEVNREPVNIDYCLKNGDMVKVIDSESVKPKIEWADYLKSAGNRAQLKSYFSKTHTNKVNKGEIIFEKSFNSYIISNEVMKDIIRHYGAENLEDLYYKIGKEYVLPKDIENYIKGKSGIRKYFSSFTNIYSKYKIPSIKIPGSKEPFIVRSIEEISMATCCRPIPGDSAMLFIKNGNGLVIHQRECENAKKLNAAAGKQTRAVIWELSEEAFVPVNIKITGHDRQGVLSDIIDIIYGELDVNMRKLEIESAGAVFTGIIELYINNKKMLESMTKKITNIKGVNRVERI